MKQSLPEPFLIFLGDVVSSNDAKTGAGLVQWRGGDCIGEITFGQTPVSVGLPKMTVEEARLAGARSLVIGVAPAGGRLPLHWLPLLEEAVFAGLNIVNGLHDRLATFPVLVEAAARSRVQLIDLRTPPSGLAVGTGAPRSGLRLLTVGTDCAVGKKYAALALTDAFCRHGASATFCATGQTGIMISGRGIPLDAVPCDFISGAVEQLSPANEPEHWDVIEGQGSLFHPAYAGVTLGLIHGAQADALVLCHEAGRLTIEDLPDFPIPPLDEAAEMILRHARLTNPAVRLAGVCLNTSSLGGDAARKACDNASDLLGVPACDPIRHGVALIVAQCLAEFRPRPSLTRSPA